MYGYLKVPWKVHEFGGGFKDFNDFFPDSWGNDPIWLIFFKTGWNHQLDEFGWFFLVNVGEYTSFNGSYEVNFAGFIIFCD